MRPALPSPDYERRLKRAFPDMRLRWSNQNHEWLLEAKNTRGCSNIDPNQYPVEATDTFIRARDGDYLLLPFEPRDLPPIQVLIQGLEAGERFHHIRSAEQWADRLDMLDQAATDAKRATRRANVRAEAGELYDARWTSHRPSATHHG